MRLKIQKVLVPTSLSKTQTKGMCPPPLTPLPRDAGMTQLCMEALENTPTMWSIAIPRREQKERERAEERGAGGGGGRVKPA